MSKTALSLTFYDDELYDNLIVPYKNNRMLTDLVIRLLTKYYYDDEVRKAVDEVNNTDSVTDSYDEYFRDVNALIACWGATQDSAENILASGTSEILKSAEKRNIDEEVWGTGVPRVSKALTTGVTNMVSGLEKKSEETLNSKEYEELKSQMSELSAMVKSMCSMFSGNINNAQQQINIPNNNVIQAVTTENVKIHTDTNIQNDIYTDNTTNIQNSSTQYMSMGNPRTNSIYPKVYSDTHKEQESNTIQQSNANTYTTTPTQDEVSVYSANTQSVQKQDNDDTGAKKTGGSKLKRLTNSLSY